MIDILEDLDFVLKDIPTLDNMNNLDPSLISKLEKENTPYLIKKYRTKSHYKQSIKLLQKYLRSSYKNIMIIEQIYLTCLMFEDYKLLDMNIHVYDKVRHPRLDRIRFYYELRKYEISKLTCKSEEYVYFVSKCRELLNTFDRNLFEVYMEFMKCCNCKNKCKIETDFLIEKDYLNKLGDKDVFYLCKKFKVDFKRRVDYIGGLVEECKIIQPKFKENCNECEISEKTRNSREELRAWDI